MGFARYTFLIAGIYGLIVLVPQYFLESKIGADDPPAVTHPEYFYGFIGVAIAFQIVFLIISRDPLKYRTFMLASIVEKFSFLIAVIVLYLRARTGGQILVASLIDGFWGILFAISYFKTRTAG